VNSFVGVSIYISIQTFSLFCVKTAAHSDWKRCWPVVCRMYLKGQWYIFHVD